MVSHFYEGNAVLKENVVNKMHKLQGTTAMAFQIQQFTNFYYSL